jgi:hypothetical protein
MATQRIDQPMTSTAASTDRTSGAGPDSPSQLDRDSHGRHPGRRVSSDQRDAPERRATYLTLSGLFVSLLAAFSLREHLQEEDLELRPLDLALLGLATFRAGRLTAYDRVTRPLREPFTETRPDDSGAGETVVAKGSGAREVLGELLSCPTCAGTWIAAGLVYGLRVAPRPTRAFMTIMGSAGIADLLNCASEVLSWTGRAARKQAGG